MKQIAVVSTLILLMILLLPIIAKRTKPSPKQLMLGKICVLGAYLSVNLYLTLFSRTASADYNTRLMPFWSYIDMFKGNADLGIQIILNVLLYVPLGYLLRFVFPRFKPSRVIVTGCLISVLTEAAQLVFKLGMFEWDDMISNTLGTAIGVFSYWGMIKLMGKWLDQ